MDASISGSLDEQWHTSHVEILSDEGNADQEGVIEPPFACPGPQWDFWVEALLIIILGCALGCFAVGYVKAIQTVPALWYNASFVNQTFPGNTSTLYYVKGQPWWIAIGVCCGVVSGIIRLVLDVDELPSFITELRERHSVPRQSIALLLLGLTAQFAGAPVGPEAGLGATGCLIGQLWCQLVLWLLSHMPQHYKWIARLQKRLVPSLFCYFGAVSALSPFLPNPFVSLLLCIELASPIGRTSAWAMRSPMHIYTLMACGSISSFAVYFAIYPSPFLNFYDEVLILAQSSRIAPWDFAIGMLFGLMGSIMACAFFIIAAVAKGFFRVWSILWERIGGRRLRLFCNCIIAGALFGLFNFLFPMSMGPGDIMIGPIIKGSLDKSLDQGILISSAFIKMLSFWITTSGGLVGGIFFPTLSMGLMVAEAFYQWTNVNHVVATSCGFIALSTAFIPTPATLVMLSFLSFVVGPQGMFPIFACGLVSYLFFIGIGVPQFLLSLRKEGKTN